MKRKLFLLLAPGIAVITACYPEGKVFGQENNKRKPSFSQLDFDNTVQPRSRPSAPSEGQRSPLEMLMKQAEREKHEKKDQNKSDEADKKNQRR
jgi:hypothetical protein